MRAAAFQGRVATVGYVDGVMRSEIDIEALHSKRLHLFGVSNKLRDAAQRAETVRGFVADVLPAIADGRIAGIDGCSRSSSCRRRWQPWSPTRTSGSSWCVSLADALRV
jgi:NADPH:quinone reductase-like Zn-dependent oxidoreductase